MVICLERGADLHMAKLSHCHSLSLASVKSTLVFTFLIPAHLGSLGQSKRVCVCVCVRACVCYGNLILNVCMGNE